MASLLTTYQRDRLKKENALGVVVIRDESEWDWVVVDPTGAHVGQGHSLTEEEATTEAGLWCLENFPNRIAIHMA